MLFNSFEFFILGLILIPLYFHLDYKNQNKLLLFFSYIFYGWWDYRFLPLIIFSSLIDYFCSIGIHSKRYSMSSFFKTSIFCYFFSFLIICIRWSDALKGNLSFNFREENRWILLISFLYCLSLGLLLYLRKNRNLNAKIFLVFSMFTNLSLLCFFKYFNFFIDSFYQIFSMFDLTSSGTLLNIILPMGISFYTFQTMSYTIDVFHKKIKPGSNFLEFSLFVSYFPQLVAGPIERATNLLPKISLPRSVSLSSVKSGVLLVVLGFFKKLVIADNISGFVDSGFSGYEKLTFLDSYLTTLFFYIQIYCDFSGYSDIARGISRILGINLMVNFKNPLVSISPSEFWKRWHISLSSWLRDYLYISLGGNRSGVYKNYRNLMITMLLGGLWHGASWNFLLWGGFHGFILVIYKIFNIENYFKSGVQKLMGWLVFFHLTLLGWLFFRAGSFEVILGFLSNLLLFKGFTEITIDIPGLLFWGGVTLVLINDFFVTYKLKNFKFLIMYRISFGLFFVYCLLGNKIGNSSEFIYFQF